MAGIVFIVALALVVGSTVAVDQCVLRIDGEDTKVAEKGCFACSFECLGLKECEGMEWMGSSFVPVHHLANYTCPDAPTGPQGERLCVLLTGKDSRVVDASPKTCPDCLDACAGESKCRTMAWDYLLVGAKHLETMRCPRVEEQDEDEEQGDEAQAPAPSAVSAEELEEEWRNLATARPSPYPTPSPAYTSPAPAKDCQIFNDDAFRFDNSEKDCHECQRQCVMDDQCSYVQLNMTASAAPEDRTSLNKTQFASYHCQGWVHAGNASAEYQCTVLTTAGYLRDQGKQTCETCTDICLKWGECETMIFNFDTFAKTSLPPAGECPIGQAYYPAPALSVAGRRLLSSA